MSSTKKTKDTMGVRAAQHAKFTLKYPADTRKCIFSACTHTFSKWEGLAKHYRKVHAWKEEDRAFVCMKCNFKTTRYHSMHRHYDTHGGKTNAEGKSTIVQGVKSKQPPAISSLLSSRKSGSSSSNSSISCTNKNSNNITKDNGDKNDKVGVNRNSGKVPPLPPPNPERKGNRPTPLPEPPPEPPDDPAAPRRKRVTDNLDLGMEIDDDNAGLPSGVASDSEYDPNEKEERKQRWLTPSSDSESELVFRNAPRRVAPIKTPTVSDKGASDSQSRMYDPFDLAHLMDDNGVINSNKNINNNVLEGKIKIEIVDFNGSY